MPRKLFESPDSGWFRFFRVIFFILILLVPSETVSARKNTVRVGVYDNPPLIFQDSSGATQGVFADILRSVAAREGWALSFIPGSLNGGLDSLAAGRIDLMPAVGFSAELGGRFSFSSETVFTNWGQVYLRNGADIQSIPDLNGKTVLLAKNDLHNQAFRELLERFHVKSHFVEVDGYQQIFEMLGQGQADAGVVNRLWGIRNQAAYKIIRSPVVFNPVEDRFAALPSREALLTAIDVQLAEMKADAGSFYYRSLNRWLGITGTVSAVPAWIPWVIGTGGLLIVFFMVLNLTLKFQVESKTALLKAHNVLLQSEIDERRRTAAAQRESEERFRSIFDQAAVGICQISPDGRFIRVNRKLCDILGYDADEMMNTTFQDITHPEDLHRGDDLRAALLAGETDKYSIQKRYRRKDGSWVWVELTVSLVTEPDGSPKYLVSVVEDINDRKRVLREKEIIALISQMFSGGSTESSIYGWLPPLLSEKLGYPVAAVELYDSGPNEMILVGYHGLDIRESLPLRAPATQVISGRAAMTGEPVQITDGNRRPKGCFSLSGENLQTCLCAPLVIDGKPMGTLSMADRDARLDGPEVMETLRIIADHLSREIHRLRSLKALRYSEEKYSKAFQASPVWVALSAFKEGRYIEVNESFLRATGFQREEVIGKTSVELGTWADLSEREDVIGHIERHGSISNREIKRRMKDGTVRDMLFCGDVVMVGGERQLLSVSLDITRHKLAEIEKKKLEAQLWQSRKMEAIGTLAGGIAHDFNNLISVILGYAELAKLDLVGAGGAVDQINQVVSAGNQARNLVQQILTFSRQTTPRRALVDLTGTVKESLKFLEVSLPRTIKIVQDLPDGLGAVLADPTQIHQVVINLCTNAAHAIGDADGRVEVSLRLCRAYSGSDKIPEDLPPGDYIRLTVRDNGPGILPEVMARIFDPFFTTKEAGKGTGMGLSVVHGIARGSGGAVTVESEPEKGAAFHVFLPVMPGMLPEEVDAGDSEIKTGSENILLIDDDRGTLKTREEILKRLGYKVRACGSSREALDLFKASPDNFDLIFTDQAMPVMTGLELAQKVRQMRRNLPVVLFTGSSENAALKNIEAEAPAVSAILRKPMTVSGMSRAVRSALDNP